MRVMGVFFRVNVDRLGAAWRSAGFSRLHELMEADGGAVLVMFAAVSPIVIGVAGLAVEAS